MTKQEEVWEGMKELLVEDLINLNITHENAPPGKDCTEECGISLEDKIAAANPVCSPLRSGGKKHKKCTDCWDEYIEGLITRLIAKQDSQGVVIKVDRELPENPIPNDLSEHHTFTVYTDEQDANNAKHQGYNLALRDMLKAGYVAIESLIEE